jgi:hypothetical protein
MTACRTATQSMFVHHRCGSCSDVEQPFHEGQKIWVEQTDGSQREAIFVGEAELSSWFGGRPAVYVVATRDDGISSQPDDDPALLGSTVVVMTTTGDPRAAEAVFARSAERLSNRIVAGHWHWRAPWVVA